MRVRVAVEASPMLEPARRALRVYVLTELHQVLRGYERSIAEADVVLTRTSHRGEVFWAVACALTLPDGSRIDLGGTGSRVHAAVDEMTLEAWRSLREWLGGEPAPPVPLRMRRANDAPAMYEATGS